ncbi:HIT family hydrolase, partial [Candidatus Bathyarchaeota archaeon]
SPHGFNIGMNIGRVAGAGVEDHLHVHVVPRWLGDTNFMPVLANTKVISQHVDEMYRALREAIGAVSRLGGTSN